MPPLINALKPPANMSDLSLVPQPPAAQLPMPHPDPNSMPNYEALSLAPAPAILSTEIDRQRQFYRHGVSQYRISPLPLKANPQVNAAARSVIASTPSSSGGGITSVGLTAPIEAVITNSPLSAPGGSINWAWATEPANTVFAGPNANVVGFDAAFTNNSGPTGTSVLSITGGIPAQAAEWSLYVGECVGFPIGNPSGWTSISNPNGTEQVSMRQLAGAAIPISTTLVGNQHWAATQVYFSGNLPTLVQNTHVVVNNNSSTLSFGGNTTAGNTVVVSVAISVPQGQSVGISITDSQGNAVNAVSFAALAKDNTVGSGSEVAVFVIQNVAAAAETITARFSQIVTGSMTIMEIAPPPVLAAIPRFRPLPAVNLGISGPGGVIGNLLHTSLNGGTNASATTFWRGDNTWASLPFSVLTGNISTTQMNSGTGAGASTFWRGDGTWALLGELAAVNLTAQNANIGATTLFAVGSLGTGTGMYEISAYVIETTADAASSTLPNVQILYTDPETNTVITIDVTPVLAGAGLGQTAALTANAIGTTAAGVIAVNAKTGTNIQYQTVNYASGTPAVMKYSLHIRLKVL